MKKATPAKTWAGHIARKEIERHRTRPIGPTWGPFSPNALRRIEYRAARLALRDLGIDSKETRALARRIANAKARFARTRDPEFLEQQMDAIEKISRIGGGRTGSNGFYRVFGRYNRRVRGAVRTSLRKKIQEN